MEIKSLNFVGAYYHICDFILMNYIGNSRPDKLQTANHERSSWYGRNDYWDVFLQLR